MSKNVLVLGGTGFLGSFVARNLQCEGFTVRIMARHLKKAHGMFDNSFEIVPGDANSAEDVCKALEGCDGAHISLSESNELTGVRNVVAAKDANLRHITYVSGATVDESHAWFPMIADKLRAEEVVRNSGVPYTIFCPTWFIEMVNNNFIQGNRAIILGKHRTPYHWLAADDFGRMVARAYQTESAYNKRLCILGPEALSMHEVLKRVCARLHPQITSVTTIPLWMAWLIAHITGNSRLMEASRLMAYFDKIGVETMCDSAAANAILGAPSTTLDQWLAAQVMSRTRGSSQN